MELSLAGGRRRLVDQRLIRQRAEVLLEEEHVIHQLRHDNADKLLLRVNPEVGGGGAAPAKVAVRVEHARLRGVDDDIEAQAEAAARQLGKADGERLEFRLDMDCAS